MLEQSHLVAITHRMVLLSALRKALVIGFLVFVFFAIYRQNWWLIPIAIVAAWVTSTVMSRYSMWKVTRITGLPESKQIELWQRYRDDPAFAVEVHERLRQLNK